MTKNTNIWYLVK